MKKKTTIYDIANHLNVTVSTVSRALNDSKSISSKTKQAVWDTAKELNYTPNKLAASLKSGKTFTIGVIVPSTRVHFFATVIHSIETHLKQEGYGILLYQTNESIESEKQGVKTLLEAQVDGIIASLSLETTTDISHFKEVVTQGKLLVLFDRAHKELNVPSVTLDDFRAGYIATEHLILSGRKNIAFITPRQQIDVFKHRFEGYLAALEEYKIAYNKDLIFYGKLSVEDGKKETENILQSSLNLDAIIAGDDFAAVGVIQKLKEKGIPAGQIAVLGFANEMFSDFVTPSLTSIEQQPEKIGQECARIFTSLITKKNPYENPEKLVIEPQIVIRKSTEKVQ